MRKRDSCGSPHCENIMKRSDHSYTCSRCSISMRWTICSCSLGRKISRYCFYNPCWSFPVERSRQPATSMQWICLNSFYLSCKFSNNFWIIPDSMEVFRERISAPDDPGHQEHSRRRSSTEDISFTLPHWISLSDLRMRCMVAGLLRISSSISERFEIFTPDHICPDFFNLLINLFNSAIQTHPRGSWWHYMRFNSSVFSQSGAGNVDNGHTSGNEGHPVTKTP